MVQRLRQQRRASPRVATHERQPVVVELLDGAQHGLCRLLVERLHGRRVRAVGEAASGEQRRDAVRSRGEPPLSAAVVAGDIDDELPLGKAQTGGLCAPLRSSARMSSSRERRRSGFGQSRRAARRAAA